MPRDPKRTSSARRHAAIMFTDIVGYTALMGSDEDRAFEMLAKNRKIHTKLIEQFKGTLVKEMGDGMLISFDLASEAVRCAIEIQKACKSEDIPLKIGIHEGEMVFEGNDVLGDGVNIASRIQDGAEEGCILISEAVYRDIKNKVDLQSKFIGERSFKNVNVKIRIYKVDCGDEIPISNRQIIHNDQRSKSKHQRMIAFIGFFVSIIVVAVIWYFSQSEKQKPSPATGAGSTEISIAVLPLTYLSEDQNKGYLADGVQDALTGHLSKIEGLRVLPRTSVEQYRGKTKTATEIGKELGVTHLIEGSFLMVRDSVILTIQLVSTNKADHIYFNEYNRDYSDIIQVQSEVAQTIAKEIEVVISPETQDRIHNVPTQNLDAYTFYLQARQYHNSYWMSSFNFLGSSLYSSDTISLDRAIMAYKKAIARDETFAESYSGLALAYWNRYSNQAVEKSVYIDSVDLLVKQALALNKNLEEAYYVKGLFERNILIEYQKAAESFQRAITINPNYTLAFLELGSLYIWEFNDYINGLRLLHKIEGMDRGYRLSFILNQLGHGYLGAGLSKVAETYFQKAFEYNNDTILYFLNMAFAEWSMGNIQNAIDWQLQSFELDSTEWGVNLFLATRYSFIADFEKAFNHLQRLKIDGEYPITPASNHRIGYILWNKGFEKEAKRFLQIQIDTCYAAIEGYHAYSNQKRAQYDLAACYAFLGEYEKAFLYLKEVQKRKLHHAWVMSYFKNDPMLDSIKDDARYKEFIRVTELNFQIARQKVIDWMNEQEVNSSSM